MEDLMITAESLNIYYDKAYAALEGNNFIAKAKMAFRKFINKCMEIIRSIVFKIKHLKKIKLPKEIYDAMNTLNKKYISMYMMSASDINDEITEMANMPEYDLVYSNNKSYSDDDMITVSSNDVCKDYNLANKYLKYCEDVSVEKEEDSSIDHGIAGSDERIAALRKVISDHMQLLNKYFTFMKKNDESDTQIIRLKHPGEVKLMNQ